MATKVDLELFRRSVPAQVKLVLLALLACLLLVVDAHTRYLEPLRQGLSVILYPFQRVVMLPRDAVVVVQDYSNSAQLLKQESEALQQQRIELSQVIGNAAQLLTENRQLRRLLGVIEDKPIHPAVVVEVLYEPATDYRRRLVFNKGSRQGIEPGMPVIDEGGIVGQVIRVTPFSAEAAMLTDEQLAVPVQLLRNGLRLIAFGSAIPGKVEVRYFSSDTDIQEGDVLVTSGVGGGFPAGISVGTVESVERDAASGFARALAQPTSHPERYRHFLILKVPVNAIGTNEAPNPSNPIAGEIIAPVTTN
jgi:rod shape-determining protein MreC|uniref:rod shape-determining protein MreC n=1 Tax=Orrella sp. TaxID=1921583 RepID=UPI0040554943